MRDPVISYFEGLDGSTETAVRRSLRRAAQLTDAPSVGPVPWKNPRCPRYQLRRAPEARSGGVGPPL